MLGRPEQAAAGSAQDLSDAARIGPLVGARRRRRVRRREKTGAENSGGAANAARSFRLGFPLGPTP